MGCGKMGGGGFTAIVGGWSYVSGWVAQRDGNKYG